MVVTPPPTSPPSIQKNPTSNQIELPTNDFLVTIEAKNVSSVRHIVEMTNGDIFNITGNVSELCTLGYINPRSLLLAPIETSPPSQPIPPLAEIVSPEFIPEIQSVSGEMRVAIFSTVMTNMPSKTTPNL